MFPLNLRNIFILIVTFGILKGCNTEDEQNETNIYETKPHLLSRRKRFLVYPEGSSLQLVFCLNLVATIPIGDIFLYGTTAALAWELPQDPYSPFEHKADPLHRRSDKGKHIYYLDEKGRLLSKVPYKRKQMINPAFAKRSIAESIESPSWSVKRGQPAGSMEKEIGIYRKRMHEAQMKREFLNSDHLNGASVEFHRHSRKGLFEQLEVFLKVLGLNGRQCILKTLCEVGNNKKKEMEQGAFVEELVHAVFTLPIGEDFKNDHHKAYDLAHRGGNCQELYPECEGSLHRLPI